MSTSVALGLLPPTFAVPRVLVPWGPHGSVLPSTRPPVLHSTV